MNQLLKYGLGLAALGVTVYVVGRAWKKSQDNKNGGTAGFAGAEGGGSKKSSGFFRPITPQCLCGGIRYDCPCPPGTR